jgi:hypothetical protein
VRRNRAQLKRVRARVKLPQIVESQNGRCYHCQKPIVVVRSIPEHLRDEVVYPHIYFRDEDGDYLFALFATIDHIKPLSANGNNHPSNLVASCAVCNQRRGDHGGSR